ncbi:hypothetical protein OAO18_07065 [Francisellaceae bacterium]|nr:hypothetical protein [Francisellaceae bacterium]
MEATIFTHKLKAHTVMLRDKLCNAFSRSAQVTALGAIIIFTNNVQALSSTTIILQDGGLNKPSSLAFRPGSEELWVTNYGNDSITIISQPTKSPKALTLQDAYGEHFMARPSGIAFDDTGIHFAVSNDSKNELREMSFHKNPERNKCFKNNNFMGPTLFNTDTYAKAGQNKQYLDDWPQPGIGAAECNQSSEHWDDKVSRCVPPREGSHLDMLHESPLSTGIVHQKKNTFFVLDGCGGGLTDGTCKGYHHVVMYDFNRDHQEGNGFHGDGVVHRYIDAPYKRVKDVTSGMILKGNWLYYADTGHGVVRRLDIDSGNYISLVGSWTSNGAIERYNKGSGVVSWVEVPHISDGDDPKEISEWVAKSGNSKAITAAGEQWLEPREVLLDYGIVKAAVVEDVVPSGTLSQPSGMTAGKNGFYVADYATGKIHQFSWNGKPNGIIETGAKGLSGLAYHNGHLFFTDMVGNTVSLVRP